MREAFPSLFLRAAAMEKKLGLGSWMGPQAGPRGLTTVRHLLPRTLAVGLHTLPPGPMAIGLHSLPLRPLVVGRLPGQHRDVSGTAAAVTLPPNVLAVG